MVDMHPCKCGSQLKKGVEDVEFFGRSFGKREVETCTRCGSSFLSQEVLESIEADVKKAGLFGKTV
ncbi:MAG TPA: hypothetical protein VLJ21_04190 [Candidatus Binatia bacterium]|nr:hypothetical protein [Candidatus Binatia bacterium]